MTYASDVAGVDGCIGWVWSPRYLTIGVLVTIWEDVMVDEVLLEGFVVRHCTLCRRRVWRSTVF